MSAFYPSLSLLCAALLCSSARAQTIPPAPPVGGASAHHDPIALDQLVVSASPFPRNQVELAQSTQVLGGLAFLTKQQPTLGETLAAEPGMSATSFGPGASRPIIRGLGGDRIRLLENAVGTIDASVASPDHAVSVEPFLVERVEVVRGPAALLYGSAAVGGVVNVITHRIETELPTERFRGAAELRYGSAADEFSRGGFLDTTLVRRPDLALVLHLDGFRRSADDLRIPDFAESARVRQAETEEALEHGEPVPEFARGRLPNSALDSEGGAAGLSLVGRNFHAGFSYSGFDSEYGVPGHAHAHGDEHEEGHEEEEHGDGEAEGVRIDLRQRRTDLQAEVRRDDALINAVRFKLGLARYRHVEREPDGAVGTVFANKGHDARLEVLHRQGDAWSGALGVQSTRSRFSAAGEEAFLPPSDSRSAAVFAFEEIDTGAVAWQFGARAERTRLTPAGGSRRSDSELSGSAGAVWEIDRAHTLAVNLSHTGRAPNAQELFAEGPHAGTQSYELGDPTLGAERSLGAEISLRRRTGFVTGSVSVFANRFDGYIFEQPNGLVAIEHDGEWEFVAPDDEEAEEHGGGLPVLSYIARDARFWGAELETIWHLHESTGRLLDLRLAADLTRARAAGRDLPRIPAVRTTAGLHWTAGGWSAGAESQFVFDQKRVAPNETPTDGYTLVSAYLARDLTFGRATAQLFARGSNLLDEEVRPHTSFVKDLAPLAGRAVTVGVRFAF